MELYEAPDGRLVRLCGERELDDGEQWVKIEYVTMDGHKLIHTRDYDRLPRDMLVGPIEATFSVECYP